jgi:hypothetical protein
MRHLVIDGCTSPDTKQAVFDSDPAIGKYPPFVVFDVDKQDYVTGSFQYRWQARLMRWLILNFWSEKDDDVPH